MRLKKIHNCTECSLFKNQKPLLDKKNTSDVMWVGLSAVKVSDLDLDIPLSEKTKSGQLISNIENSNPELLYYKTNLVKCLPLINGKIRYPTKGEMSQCFQHLLTEIHFFKPKIVFFLGKAVYDFVAKQEKHKVLGLNKDFKYKSFKLFDTLCVPVHHPSFVLIYKRKHIDRYVMSISSHIENISQIGNSFH